MTFVFALPPVRGRLVKKTSWSIVESISLKCTIDTSITQHLHRLVEAAHTVGADALVVQSLKPRHQGDSRRDNLKKKAVLRDVSCEITTRDTSFAAVIVVAPRLHSVVVGRVFLGSALLAVLPLQLLEHPVPRCLDASGGLVTGHGTKATQHHNVWRVLTAVTRLGRAAQTTARRRSDRAPERRTSESSASPRCRAPAA